MLLADLPLPTRVAAPRVAWITGAGRGIGRACALALARQGMSVGATARSRDELAQTVTLCKKEGVDALVAVADVTQQAKVRAAHTAISKALGAPDVLVNAAGLARSESFLKTTPAFMAQLWDLNVMGTFHPMQAALPALVAKKWGRIVNIASVAAKVGHPYVSAYTASKHGVLGLTRAVAAEVGESGVTVNAVCPGYVNTAMTDDNIARMVQKTKKSAADIRHTIEHFSPQHRMMEPDEVAALVAFLCRDEAFGIHGQAITLDGGGIQW